MIVIKSNWYLLLRLAYTLLGAYFVSTSSVVGQTHWEWQNPWPQGSDIWAVCFVNADSGFTVGQAGTINRTTDGGVTWLHCKSGTVADLFDVSFSDAYHGTAVGKIGTIVRTTDGGLSWALQTSGTSGWFRAVSFVNTQSGTAVGIDGIIYHTTNGGLIWYPQSSGTTAHLFGISHPSPGHWIAVGAGGLILYSGDDGTTWSPQTSGITTQLTDVFFTNSTVGWTIGVSGTILHTTNEGISWTPQASGTSNHLYGSSFSDADNGIVAGLNGEIRVTTDGGATWLPRSSGTMMHLYGLSCGDAQHAWAVGYWGEIVVTMDGGTSWTRQQKGTRQNLHGVAFTDSLTGFAVGDSGIILATTDGGYSWYLSHSGTIFNLADIQFVDSGFGMIVGDGGTILKTTDGGVYWGARPSPVQKPLRAVSFKNTNSGTIVGSNCPFLYSTDGGETWELKYYYQIFQMSDVQMLSDSTGLASGSGYFYTTQTGWDSVLAHIVIRQPLYGIYFLNWLSGTLVGESGQIFQTSDGSVTFQSRNSGVTTRLNKIAFSNDTTGIVVGNEGAIIYSTDQGMNWSSMLSGTIFHLNNLFFINDRAGWIVGDRGTILHYEQHENGGDTTTQFSVQAKWNIVSVPYKVDDYAKTHLFPTANSNAFRFDNGYYPQDTLENGRGYWLKFPSAQTIVMDGTQLDAETVDVTADWNMVGSLSTTINVGGIASIPGGIVTSAFYQYDGSYTQSPIINPGKGYWVKVSQSGKLIFTSTSHLPSASRIRIEDHGEFPPAPPDRSDRIISYGEREQYELSQNYPNPFNPSTEIEYSIPKESHVRLIIYDLLGQSITTLVDQEVKPGFHKVRWDATGATSGIYYCMLLTDNYQRTLKMLVIK